MTDTPPTLYDPRTQHHAADVWHQLASLDFRLLELLAYLSSLTSRKSPRNAHYCTPGRAWLARRLRCSVETISEHTSHLERLGLIHKTQRRPLAGRYQTCLYAFVHPMAWGAARIKQLVIAAAHRVPRMAHKTLRPMAGESDSRAKESLRDIISRGLARWGPQPA